VSPVAYVLLALLVIPLVIALMRANELFCLELRDKKLVLARGRIPQRLLNDMADVVRDSGATTCTIRGLSEGNRAVVEARGDLGEGHRQRLRNVIAQWPVARIRTASRGR
jgi:hypothetical protein